MWVYETCFPLVGRFVVLQLQNVPYHLIGLKSIVAMFTGCIGHGISPQSAMRSQVLTLTKFAKWSSTICLYYLFSLEILPQEMFWLGLRVELRSHLPPNWSDLIYLIVILGLNFNLSWFHLFTLKHYSPHRWRTLDLPGTSLSASIIERLETARWKSWKR